METRVGKQPGERPSSKWEDNINMDVGSLRQSVVRMGPDDGDSRAQLLMVLSFRFRYVSSQLQFSLHPIQDGKAPLV